MTTSNVLSSNPNLVASPFINLISKLFLFTYLFAYSINLVDKSRPTISLYPSLYRLIVVLPDPQPISKILSFLDIYFSKIIFSEFHNPTLSMASPYLFMFSSSS